MYAYGDLNIVVGCPIGQLGSTQGQAMSYAVSPLIHVVGIVYLAPIGLAFLLLRENRRLSAAWIFLPMLLAWGSWLALAAIMHLNEEAKGMTNSLIMTTLAGFVTVWLMGERIGHRHRFVSFLLAAAILMSSICLSWLEIPLSSYMFWNFQLFGWLIQIVLLGGFVFAGFRCRRRFGPVRFSLWTMLGILVFTALLFGLYDVYFMFSYSMWDQWLISLVWVLIYGCVIGAAVLPFLVLFFVNDFWRGRFAAVMGLGAKTAAEPQASPPKDSTCPN